MEIVVGTRGSKLALVQTNWVIENLKINYPEHTFTIKVIQTKGDKIQNVALDKIGDKGVFVKEIEEQLLDGTIDIAVHSMKDMPSEVRAGLCFSKIPKREDRRDALVLREKITRMDELPQGAVIGTGSKRRKYQLLKIRPDLHIVPIRGNIDTRIGKIQTEGLDGIVLAAAGLKRAKLEDNISYIIPEEQMVPAPAQGALGLQIREGDEKTKEILRSIQCLEDDLEVQAERAFLKQIEGSCHLPIGASAKLKEGRMTVVGIFGNEEGTKFIKKSLTEECTSEEDAVKIGIELAKCIMKEVDSYEG